MYISLATLAAHLRHTNTDPWGQTRHHFNPTAALGTHLGRGHYEVLQLLDQCVLIKLLLMCIGRCHVMMLLVVVRQAQCRGLSATSQRLHFPIGVKSWELIWKKRGFYHQSGWHRHCRLLVVNWWHVQVRIVQFTWIGPLIVEATLVKEAVSIAP